MDPENSRRETHPLLGQALILSTFFQVLAYGSCCSLDISRNQFFFSSTEEMQNMLKIEQKEKKKISKIQLSHDLFQYYVLFDLCTGVI